MSDLYTDPIGTAELAAAKLGELTGKAQHHVALVMGSGWIDAADSLGTPTHEFDATALPGFLPPTVVGHGGKIRSYDLQGPHGIVSALVFLGRTHLYEGKGIEPVVHGVRTAVKSGCSVVVLTNACGGINRDYTVGQPVLIRDHISLTGVSPLIGGNFVHALGAEILGISLVTNAAAGMTGEKLSHEEVMAAGKASAGRIGTLLAIVLRQL